MPKIQIKALLHALAAAAVVFAVTTTYAYPAQKVPPLPPVAPGPIACVSPERILERAGAKPTYDLHDEDLIAFNENFKQLEHADPIVNDRLWIFINEQRPLALFVSFLHGCVNKVGLAPPEEIEKIMYGNRRGS